MTAFIFTAMNLSPVTIQTDTGTALSVLVLNGGSLGGGGGSSNFLGLTDTPASYGLQGQVPAINAGTNALEWVTPFSGVYNDLASKPTTLAGYGITDAASISHTHAISDITNLQTSLDSKAATSHTHAISNITNLQTALDGKAASVHSHAIADVTGLQTALDGKAASSHSHTIADTTGLQTALDGKAASSHTHTISNITNLQNSLNGKADISHTHAISDVVNLQTNLDGKAALSHNHSTADITSGTLGVNRGGTGSTSLPTVSNYTPGASTLSGHLSGIDTALSTKAASTHSHAISDTTGLQTALDGKAASSHTHAAADITSGTIASARLGSGTANSTTFLRGDGQWQAPPAAGSPAWGDISGTLSAQTDLQTALNGKAASSHSHAISDVTNLQTALDGKASTAHSHVISDTTGLQTALDGKAASSHTHAISEITSLQTTLDGKAATSHSHSASDITSGTLAVNRGGTGSTALTTPTNYTAASATVQSHLAGINTALGTRAASTHTHAISDVAGLQTALDGKAASSHTHAISDTTGLQTALDGKAASSHTHTLSQITDAGTAAASNAGDFEASGAVSTHASATSGVHGISSFGATLVDDANAAAARTTLGAAAESHTHTHTDAYIGHIESPAVRTYFIDLKVPAGRTITQIHAKTSAGTVDLTLKNGADNVWTADGIDSVGVSVTSGLSFTSLAVDGTLSLVADAASGAADLQFSVRYTQTVPAS